MRPAGADTVAIWREARQWWIGESATEHRRWIDNKGVMREEQIALEPLGMQGEATYEYDTSQREEWSLRIQKTRDEKVAKACGLLPPTPSVHKRTRTVNYAPLHVLSGYAFGRGTMLAVELPILAAQAGIPAIALTDPFSFVGAVEFAHSAQKCGVKPLIGTTIEIPEGGEIVLIARNKEGYRNLSHLITECHLNEPRLFPLSNWERLQRYSSGVLCLTGGDRGPLNHLVTRGCLESAQELLVKLKDVYGARHVFVEIERSYLPWEAKANRLLIDLAAQCGLVAVAGGEITHARRDHYPAQDILTCVESLCTVEEIVGRKPQRDPTQPQVKPRIQRALNAERFLRTPEEMTALYLDASELLDNTHRVAAQCEDDVLPGRTTLPKLFPDGAATLYDVTFMEARERHRTISTPLRKRLEHELARITRRGFADHFLIIWDACKWAREQGIQMSGRGSVVDCAVAYCIGLSRIDAFKHKLHFDRFLPEDDKRPDIDIDFEARRRDDVRNYMRLKYGDDKVATVAAIGSYRTRGIVREVGKALELPLETVNFLCKRIHGGVSAHHLESALEKRPELRNSDIPKEKFKWVFLLAERLMDVPRGMRSHSSGVIISDRPMADTVPVTWSGADEVKIVQWDKRSAKYFFDKFDILCLRGQDVLSGTEKLVHQSNSGFDLEGVEVEHEENFRAMRAGQLIGVPQSASPAMRQAHQRLQTRDLHDASLVQAGIRPGVGGAVKLNELIARKLGKKSYSFLHPELERILGITYGLVVFQEQVDQLLQSFAGYSSGKAEEMREQIHEKRHERYAEDVQQQVFADIMAQGHGLQIAESVFDYVAGFKGYGFAQGHALAFAEISLRSIYCQREHPAEYFAALLNAQPAGYYGPSTIANEARLRGAKMLPPDVNFSEIEFSVEDVQSADDPKFVFPHTGVRVGLKQIQGLSAQTLGRIVKERWNGFYNSIFDFAARARPERDELENLILCGALDRIGENRRSLLWSIPKALEYMAVVNSRAVDTLPLPVPEPSVEFSGHDLTAGQRAVYERVLMGLDVERHLLAFERDRIKRKGGLTAGEASALPNKTKAFVVGNPLRLRFPPTSSGKRVMFFDLEDETGLLNVTCFDETYQRYGHAVVCNAYVTLFGEAQDRDGHTAFLAQRILPYQPTLESQLIGDVVRVGDFLVG